METTENNNDVKQLHFSRARAPHVQGPFVDPMADIKEVIEQSFQCLPLLFGKAFGDEKNDYLKAYLRVFQTRLAEDKAPMLEQLAIFEGAMKERFTKEELEFIRDYIFHFVMATYALHYRRDACTDMKDRQAMRATAGLLSLFGVAKKETLEAFDKELGEHTLQLKEELPSTACIDAHCIEDSNKTVRDIKGLVATLFEPGCTWEEAAKACDAYAQNAIEQNGIKEQEVAAALAYPDYKYPYFEGEVDV